MDAAVQQLDEQLERLGPHAGEAACQDVRAQQQQRARLGLAERIADSRRVRAQQVELQLAQAVERDVDVGEVAEAGRDAVDDRAARDRVVDDAPGGRDRRARRRGERDRASAARHRLERVEVEAAAVDGEGKGVGGVAHPGGSKPESSTASPGLAAVAGGGADG